MRIGMIYSTPFPPREGIGFYVWNLSRWLINQGHQVHLITRGKFPTKQYKTAEGILVWKPCFLPLYPFHVQTHNLFVSLLLRHLEHELDLLHLHSPLVKLPKTSLPVIVTIHTPIKADSRSVRLDNLFSLLIKLQTPFSLAVETDVIQKAQRLTTVASSVRQELSEYGIEPERIAVVGNGVDVHLFCPAELYPGDSSSQYVLTVSRLAPRKGLEDLIQSAKIVHKLCPNLHFIIIGEGPLRKNFHSLIARLGLEEVVHLRGHVHDRTELVAYYQKCVAYVHPSHYEGLPTSLLEAMACARPIIATAVSGNLDVIENGKNGLLVPPQQPEQLADAILRVLSSPELTYQLSMAARETVCERYSWDTIGQRYLMEYQALLGSRSVSI